MRKGVTRAKPSWTGFAGQLRGDARAAAICARRRRGNAGMRGMPPWILIPCLAAVAGRRRRGEPLPETVRRLADTTETCLVPGAATERVAADLARLDQMYRDFRCRPEDGEAAIILPPSTLAPVFDPLLGPSRYKGAYGGRGSGKSHAFAELLVRRCVEAAPLRAVCIREVQRSLDQSVKRLIEV